jgi:hypothetical protein
MKQCTTSIHLTRTIHWLEHILSDEDFPAVCAASLLAETLCEIAPMLPEEEQHQIARIVALYALWQLSTQHPPPHEKHELLKTLYLALVKLNRSGIIPSERVRKLGEAIQQLSILPSIRVRN